MSKAKIRAAVQRAAQFSDEGDVAQLASGSHGNLDRAWARLNSFMVSFAASLAEIDEVAARQLREFQDRVIDDENPLAKDAPEGTSK